MKSFSWIIPFGISPKRDYKVREHEVFYSSCFILPDCFLERSNLWIGRTLKVISFKLPLLWMLESPLQFMMPPAMCKHFYLSVALPILGFAVLIYFFASLIDVYSYSWKAVLFELLAKLNTSVWWVASCVPLCVNYPPPFLMTACSMKLILYLCIRTVFLCCIVEFALSLSLQLNGANNLILMTIKIASLTSFDANKVCKQGFR